VRRLTTDRLPVRKEEKDLCEEGDGSLISIHAVVDAVLPLLWSKNKTALRLMATAARLDPYPRKTQVDVVCRDTPGGAGTQRE